MRLRVKISILCGFTKNSVYRWGHEKLIYRRELPKKGGLGQLEGGLGKKEGGGWDVFEGGWRVIPQCTP